MMYPSFNTPFYFPYMFLIRHIILVKYEPYHGTVPILSFVYFTITTYFIKHGIAPLWARVLRSMQPLSTLLRAHIYHGRADRDHRGQTLTGSRAERRPVVVAGAVVIFEAVRWCSYVSPFEMNGTHYRTTKKKHVYEESHIAVTVLCFSSQLSCLHATFPGSGLRQITTRSSVRWPASCLPALWRVWRNKQEAWDGMVGGSRSGGNGDCCCSNGGNNGGVGDNNGECCSGGRRRGWRVCYDGVYICLLALGQVRSGWLIRILGFGFVHECHFL